MAGPERGGRGDGFDEAARRVKLAPRHAKILMAIYYRGADGMHAYEDIVVEAFQRFPGDFHMRGYPQFPDSSDLHKPLYKELKAAGYVTSRDKRFGLTPTGTQVARALVDGKVAEILAGDGETRLDRETDREIKRLLGTEASRRHRDAAFGTVVDTDFHEFFRTSVRTPNRDFEGRLAQVADAIRKARRTGMREAEMLEQTQAALLGRFKELVAVKVKGGER